MIEWAYECATTKVLQTLQQQSSDYDELVWLIKTDKASRNPGAGLCSLVNPYMQKRRHYPDHRWMLRDLLQLMSQNPRFEQLTAREFCEE
jgi:hypothetical protein